MITVLESLPGMFRNFLELPVEVPEFSQDQFGHGVPWGASAVIHRESSCNGTA